MGTGDDRSIDDPAEAKSPMDEARSFHFSEDAELLELVSDILWQSAPVSGSFVGFAFGVGRAAAGPAALGDRDRWLPRPGSGDGPKILELSLWTSSLGMFW